MIPGLKFKNAPRNGEQYFIMPVLGRIARSLFADDPDQVSPETRAEWDTLCAMPGLNGYRVCSIEDLVQNQALNI